MTLLCNLYDCLHNTGGMCCQKEYLTIKNGTCSWLINNQFWQKSQEVLKKEQEEILKQRRQNVDNSEKQDYNDGSNSKETKEEESNA